ncbi:response regulator [Thioclava sp. F28-4]|uniref:response regulator n=1 Tax=Thioclava sp. F28-4 TaxID=1915315 RepID=UPI000996E579|nr:response regulator [Thioclava sp. F28-4]OOY06785.1 hypothetical protein BMI87_04720 [Thioclava sp. F28-4]
MAWKFSKSIAEEARFPDASPRGQSDSVSANRNSRCVAGRLLPKRCIVYCGEPGAIRDELAQICEHEGARLLSSSEGALPGAWLALHTEEIDILMVDGDYLGEIEDTIDYCMRVRRACPSLPVILVSSEMRADDLTCERMQACDATLKAPVSQVRLEKAVIAARQNNAFFLSRLHPRITQYVHGV